ncbi:MAG: hypothetical protein JKY37_10445 [Nannocystaceae bacterium]|nr:hypothetical protein [Nannocystaceae bacterium]
MGPAFDELPGKSLGEIVDLLPIEAVLSSLEYTASTGQLGRLALEHLTSIARLAKDSDLKTLRPSSARTIPTQSLW